MSIAKRVLAALARDLVEGISARRALKLAAGQASGPALQQRRQASILDHDPAHDPRFVSAQVHGGGDVIGACGRSRAIRPYRTARSARAWR